MWSEGSVVTDVVQGLESVCVCVCVCMCLCVCVGGLGKMERGEGVCCTASMCVREKGESVHVKDPGRDTGCHFCVREKEGGERRGRGKRRRACEELAYCKCM